MVRAIHLVSPSVLVTIAALLGAISKLDPPFRHGLKRVPEFGEMSGPHRLQAEGGVLPAFGWLVHRRLLSLFVNIEPTIWPKGCSLR
jgi:hypothetical protein